MYLDASNSTFKTSCDKFACQLCKIVLPLAMLYSVMASFNFYVNLNVWACYRVIIEKGCLINLLGNFKKAGQALALTHTINHKAKRKEKHKITVTVARKTIKQAQTKEAKLR